MNVLIAIDSFKGSLDTLAAGRAVSEAAMAVFENAETEVCPLADGGEGTMDAVIASLGGRVLEKEVTGPLGERVRARLGIVESEKLAVVEMASAAGLPLVPEDKRDPKVTTTRGVGELILCAVKEYGCRRFLVGIGGSATNDGGAGMLNSLGFEFLDRNGNSVPDGATGLGMIEKIKKDRVPREIFECEFNVACDVNNPLCGERGASAVYGPQKGASPSDVEMMDGCLSHFADITSDFVGRDMREYPGAGAAGGMGFAFVSYLNGRLQSGIDLVIEANRIEEKVKAADIVITGEGRLDRQSCMGKAPVGIAKIAKKYGKICIALSGCIGDGAEQCNEHGIDAYFPILPTVMPLEEAMSGKNAYKNLKNTAIQAFNLIKACAILNEVKL